MINKSTILVIFLLVSTSSFGQKVFKVHISFPKDIPANKISVVYDRGDGERKIDRKLKENSIDITDTLISSYSIIIVDFKDHAGKTIFINKFLVNDVNSKITYSINQPKGKKSDSSYIDLIDVKLDKVLNLKKDEDKYEKFVTNEKKDLQAFVNKNNKKLDLLDSITVKKYFEKMYILNKKTYDFIVQNPSNYSSFLLFKNNLMFSNFETETLNKLFYSAFSKTLINGDEVQKVSDYFKARSLKIGSRAPVFKSLDLNGDSIDINEKENILLVFWATWCKPCMEELPAVIKIRKDFSEDKLKIIAVSLDKNTELIKTTINKFNIKWINIKGTDQIINKYVVNGIPAIFLIKNGNIIYKRDEEPLQKINQLPILNKKLLKL